MASLAVIVFYGFSFIPIPRKQLPISVSSGYRISRSFRFHSLIDGKTSERN